MVKDKMEAESLSPDSIKKIGRAIGGTHWQADVARDIDYSKSMITRVLNGTRTADSLFADGLRDVMLTKIENVTALLGANGLSGANSPTTKKAQAMIREAVALLRQKPAKKRT